MSIFNIPLDQIKKETIEFLLGNVKEGREIDFKRQLNVMSKEDKKEFLKDVASFASASGGDIIYGVAEKDAIADAITPLEIENIDSTTLQIEQIIRTGISPRINFTVYPIEIEPKKYILILRVYKHYQAPVMVSFNGTSRFFSRHSTGIYQLDYQQIKDGFLSHATYKERFIKFRNERIDHYFSGDDGNHPDKPFYLFWIYPVNEQNFDVTSIPQSELTEHLDRYSGNYRYTVDGFSVYSSQNADDTKISLLYNGGTIEIYDERVMHQDKFQLIYIDDSLFKDITKFIDFYKKINLFPPFIISLTLFNLKNKMIHQPYINLPDYERATKNTLFLPEIVINSYEGELATILKPLFDSLWRCFGASRSFLYGADGVRKELK